MQNNHVIIRKSSQRDCRSIFEWRNDDHSQKMFFDESLPTYQDHSKWFATSLSNPNRQLYIGEIDGEKIGVCRFDYDMSTSKAEVSINMNPLMRGKGIGKQFLAKAMDEYLSFNEVDLTARIKQKNYASKKIFEFVGFNLAFENDEVIYLERPISELYFKQVEKCDIEVLFELLKRRVHSISHESLPSLETHKKFVETYPYEHWYLVFESENAVGTFYVQSDNSIGLNLLNPSKRSVRKIINYITDNFSPKSEIKSKIPSFFFINVAQSNQVLQDIIKDLDCLAIQTSYKLK